MPFSELIKKEVKIKAHYKCCICESFEFLHVHHIKPENEGGPNEIDNAAPLCTRCHSMYGGNPDLQKWIKEKRDFWYEHCKKKLYNEDVNQLEKTYIIIENISQHQEKRLKNAEKYIKILKNIATYLTKQNMEILTSLEKIPESEKPIAYAQLKYPKKVI